MGRIMKILSLFFPQTFFTLPSLIFPVTCFCLFYEKNLKKKLVLQVKGQKKKQKQMIALYQTINGKGKQI
jgi:hypothetical protein